LPSCVCFQEGCKLPPRFGCSFADPINSLSDLPTGICGTSESSIESDLYFYLLTGADVGYLQ
jgi:hypothetical protein